MPRCRYRCGRDLLPDGTCPLKCEQYARPTREAQRADRAVRLRAKRARMEDESLGGAYGRGIECGVMLPPEKDIGSLTHHQRRKTCPQCGSVSFRPGDRNTPSQCADCGPIVYQEL